MPSNKALRKICVLNAAHDVVRVLEQHGILCALAGPLAAFVHGSPKAPIDATFAVIPTGNATRLLDDVARILVTTPGQLFRRSASSLIYYDPTAQVSDANKRKMCRVDIQLPPHGDLSAGYQRARLQRVMNLPVVGVLQLTVEMCAAALEAYHRRSAAIALGQPIAGRNLLPNSRVATIDVLLTPSNRRNPTGIPDKVFNERALAIFTAISDLSASLSVSLRPLVNVCQRQLDLQISQPVPDGAKTAGELLTLDENEGANELTAHDFAQSNQIWEEALNHETMQPSLGDRLELLGDITPQNLTKKKCRRVCILNATFDAIQILAKHGIECVLTDRLAAHLHGAPRIPTAVSIVILPQADGIVPKPSAICQMLHKSSGGAFRYDNKDPGKFKYFDPTASDSDIPRRRACAVTISPFQDSHPGYTDGRVYIHGLPVIGKLPLLMDFALANLESLERSRLRASKRGKDPELVKLPKGLRGMRALLRTLRGKELPPIGVPMFNQQAISIFKEMSALTPPEIRNALSQIIRLCDKQLHMTLHPSLLDGKEVETAGTENQAQWILQDGKDVGLGSDGDSDSDEE